MWRIILTQFLMIMLFCDESLATHGIFRVLPELQPTFDHQQYYVQPQQRLIVYPHLHQASMPQFYQSPQSLYIPQNTYDGSRYIVQSTGGFYDPVVSYIHHQNPYQAVSFMNLNSGGKLFNRKLEDSDKTMDSSDNPVEGVMIKSGMEPQNDKHDEQYKKEMQDEMLITSNNSMENTTMLEMMKDKIENEENSTTATVREAKSDSETKV